MAIHQGDIYWVHLDTESDIPHPHVVLQDTTLNNSPISTVVACALTSNLRRVSLPGNILLAAGEANLPRQSVVDVAKITTLDKAQLGAYIGTLTPQRVEQIFAGLRFIQTAFLQDRS